MFCACPFGNETENGGKFCSSRADAINDIPASINDNFLGIIETTPKNESKLKIRIVNENEVKNAPVIFEYGISESILAKSFE
jgi:hypothetical protein